ACAAARRARGALLPTLPGVPLLMSNLFRLLVPSLATNRRVPAGFTARAMGLVAPAGRAVFAPLVGTPLLMSNIVTLLESELATNSDWNVDVAVAVGVAVAVAVAVGVVVAVAVAVGVVVSV